MDDAQDTPAGTLGFSSGHSTQVIPAPAVATVSRPRVVRLLDEASRRRVTLVTGGSGSGKTVAVADWTRQGRPPGPVVWVSLSAAEADAGRLWSALLMAVEQQLGEEVAPASHSVFGLDQVNHLFSALGRRGAVLVLDDVHLIESGGALGLLDAVLRLRPSGLRMILICRHDPPLALHRLRVAGELGDIRSADLAFTAAEAQTLFADHGLALPAATVAQLVDNTQGWASGMRLACLTLASASDPVAAAATFDGRSPYIIEYVMHEVAGLDEERRHLLLSTCGVDEVCASLAQALSGNARAGTLLQSLAMDDYFTLAPDGRYRPHNLILQVLRAQLHTTDPALEAQLHRRAANWFEEHGAGLDALRHAILARDWDLVGIVVQQSIVFAFTPPGRGALQSVLTGIPPAVADGRPELEVALACREYCLDDLVAASAHLLRAEQHLATLPQPRRAAATFSLRLLQSTIAHRCGDAAALVASATLAERARTEVAGVQPSGWRGLPGLAVGLIAVGELWSGRPGRALDLLDQALVDARELAAFGFSDVNWRGQIALAEGAMGFVARSRCAAQEVLGDGSQLRAASGEFAAAWLALAQAALRQGDLCSAIEAVAEGEQANTGEDPFVAAGLRLVAAERRLALGDLGGARDFWSDLAAQNGDLLRTPWLAAMHTAVGVGVELAARLPARAAALLAAHDARLGAASGGTPEPDVLTITRARLLLATGCAADVRGVLGDLLKRQGAGAAEAWLVVSLAEDALRRDAAAIEALGAALDAAASQEFVLPFLNPGRRLAMMLRRHVEVIGSHRDLVDRLVGTARAADHDADLATAEPLTDRERSVLAYLPTLSSNSEIAAALGISVNTVKQHLKSINRKLGVGTRRDAVRIARRLDLLPRVADRRLV